MEASHDPRASDPLFAGLIAFEDLHSRLGMSRHALYRLLKLEPERFPRRMRIGRKLFVSEAAVHRWLVNRLDADAA